MKSIVATSFLFAFSLLVNVANAASTAYSLSESTYRVLNEAQQLMDKSQYAQAEKQLLSLLDATKTKSYDWAMAQQTLGYLYSAQENYPKAIQAFQQAINSQALPEDLIHDLRFNVGQMLIADNQFKQGIEQLEIWLKTEKQPDVNVYVLLATANYQINQFSKAAENLRVAISKTATPKEDWYRLLLSSYLSMQQYKSAISVVETLLNRYPKKKEYWDQLASLYVQQNAEFQSLAVRRLTQRLDLADADIVSNLADMYRYLGVPYKAAQLLQQGMDEGVINADFTNQQRLADSLIAARESQQAIAVLERIMAEDTTGKSAIQLAEIYRMQEQWQPLVTTLTNAMSRLQGGNRGKVHLLLGTAYFNLAQYEQATAQFNQAVQYDEQSREASQWLQHLQQLEKQVDATAS